MYSWWSLSYPFFATQNGADREVRNVAQFLMSDPSYIFGKWVPWCFPNKRSRVGYLRTNSIISLRCWIWQASHGTPRTSRIYYMDFKIPCDYHYSGSTEKYSWETNISDIAQMPKYQFFCYTFCLIPERHLFVRTFYSRTCTSQKAKFRHPVFLYILSHLNLEYNCWELFEL